MAKSNSTYVFIHLAEDWVPCGYLTIWEDGRFVESEFEYRELYLKRSDAIPVDPIMLPLKEGKIKTPQGMPMFGGIRDTVPDSWGRQLLEGLAEPAVPGEFEYLTAIPPEDRVGAVAFGRDLSVGPESIHPGWKNFPVEKANLDIEEMIKVSDQVLNDQEIDRMYRGFLIRGASLGGAQPKAPVMFNSRPWIAKFGRKFEAWNTCRIEWANMLLASECGIDVPEMKVITIRNRDVYLISRFDRDAKGNRFHFITAATLLGVSDIKKGSYPLIAEKMRTILKNDLIDAATLQLFRRMVFNILCNNTDDHLKNHGFLYHPGKGWVLSPAFDVVPQPDMGDGQPRCLTLCVGVNNSRKASLKNALSSASIFKLSDITAKQIIDEITTAFISNWERIYRECQVPDKDFKYLREVFKNHLNIPNANRY